MDQVELRKYLDIINENSEEVLTEGMLQKLAGLALGAVLALGPKIGQADTIFSYLDPNTNQMQTVMDMSKVPNDAKLVMAVDTDTKQVMVLKGSNKGQEVKPDMTAVQSTVDTDNTNIEGNKKLVGEYSVGMPLEEVLKISQGKLVKGGDSSIFKGGYSSLKGSGKIGDKDSIKVKAEGTPYGKGKTYFQFDSENKLVGVHYLADVISLAADKNLKKISKGSGLFGFPMDDLGRVFYNAYDVVKDLAGPIQGKPKLRNGSINIGGMTIGIAGASVGSGSATGIGLGIPMDKAGDGTVVANTGNGYVAMTIITQSGMVNSFRPSELIVGFMAPDASPPEIEIEK